MGITDYVFAWPLVFRQKVWVVVTQDFGCRNRYSRKVVLMHTHPGVIEGCEFTERNQRGEKPEETTKL